jgi:diguanylate cyclase (GGDEF)-like protein/PAS domain S-box-containing protein
VQVDQWLENVVSNVPGAIYRCVLRSDWEMQFISDEIEAITGYPAVDFIANRVRTYESVIHPDDRAMVEHEVFASVGRNEPFVIEYRVLRADGEVRWVHEKGRGVFDENGELSLLDGAVFDISDRKRMEAELAHLAYHDALTGLPNRTLLQEHLELALARSRRTGGEIAVLFLDLDDFKLVNDSFGHTIGDQLLCEVARRLRVAVRETDTVARQGGDEFLIVAPDIGSGDRDDAATHATALAERVRAALTAPVILADAEVYVSASIGISVFPWDADTADDLLKRSDIAMYAAKAAGRDGHAMSSGDPGESIARLSHAGRLRRAIAEEEFELHYQPIVLLETGTMVGVEALIRWRDPIRGLVPPNEFIPLAERTGAINRISEWVVAEACRQSRAWQSEGLDLYISINLPARFWRLTAMRSVLDTVETFGLSPRRLMIEITETAAMERPEGNEAIIEELRKRGVRVAIDDFGTGHSSLARLNQFAMTMLKIDRSFVRDVPIDEGASVLVAGIVQLTRSLGLEALAEGIETEEQRRFLLDQGCALGQGFLFSRPVPADQIAQYSPPPAIASEIGAA